MFDQVSHDQLLYGHLGYDRLTHERICWLTTASCPEAALGDVPRALCSLCQEQDLVFRAPNGGWHLTATGGMRWRELWGAD